MKFGFMPQSVAGLKQTPLSELAQVSFVEFSYPDDYTPVLRVLRSPDMASLFDTLQENGIDIHLHAEGEMDDRRRIRFAAPNEYERKEYVAKVADGIQQVSKTGSIMPTAVIVHPDQSRRGQPKLAALSLLAESLTELADRIKPVVVAVETRGSKKPRILQPSSADIEELQRQIFDLGSPVRLCIDVAQAFIFHKLDTEPVGSLLQDALNSNGDRLFEFHLSDVRLSKRGIPLLGHRIGSGLIDWNQLAPELRAAAEQSCRLHLEVVGGLPSFVRSAYNLTGILDLRQNGRASN